MSRDYKLKLIASETWTATCKLCGRPFRSDDKQKAVAKVTDHLRDSHGR